MLSAMTSNSLMHLNEDQHNLLCFGFTRKWFELINSPIKIDDIANIVAKYTLNFNFGFISHPNYCKIFLSNNNSNNKGDDGIL